MSLHTLGFRGEALPSIASVSNFQLLTRPADEEFATSIRIDGGEQTECQQTGGQAGTTVIVENLFLTCRHAVSFAHQRNGRPLY